MCTWQILFVCLTTKSTTTHTQTTYTMWKAEELLDAIRYRSTHQEQLEALERQMATIREDIKREEAEYRKVAKFGNYKRYVHQLLGTEEFVDLSGVRISETDEGGTLQITDIPEAISYVRDHFKNDDEMKQIELESFREDPMQIVQVRRMGESLHMREVRDKPELMTEEEYKSIKLRNPDTYPSDAEVAYYKSIKTKNPSSYP